MNDYTRSDLGRISRRPYKSSGLDRQQRLTITLGVTAAVILALGLGVGFAVGRATAPEPELLPVQAPVVQEETTLPAGVVEDVATETVDSDLLAEEDVSQETTITDEVPPPRPKQLAPKDGAVINASRVTLDWSKVEDDSDEPVTYAFEIQDRLSGGSYGNRQVIGKLKSSSYSARVLYAKRRWRVWAVDTAGNQSDKTGWRYYQHTARPVVKPTPKPDPEPSDETT